MARRRPHRFQDSRAPGVETCVHCKVERRHLVTLARCEPIWTTAIEVLYRPRGAKFWTTAYQPCVVSRASTVTT